MEVCTIVWGYPIYYVTLVISDPAIWVWLGIKMSMHWVTRGGMLDGELWK